MDWQEAGSCGRPRVTHRFLTGVVLVGCSAHGNSWNWTAIGMSDDWVADHGLGHNSLGMMMGLPSRPTLASVDTAWVQSSSPRSSR